MLLHVLQCMNHFLHVNPTNHRATATAKSHQSCPTLCDPIDGNPPGSRPWDSPGKNTGVGCPTNHTAQLNLSVYLVTATTATGWATSIWQTRQISRTFGLDWNFKYNLVQILLFLAPFQKLREGKRRDKNRKERREKKAGTWRVNSKKYNCLGSLIIYYAIYTHKRFSSIYPKCVLQKTRANFPLCNSK